MLHLPELPIPSSRRLAVRVSPDALRQIRGGHPWVFESSIRSVNHDGAAGDLAVVFDDRRDFVAIGLWDPASPIRLRILHHGSPTAIDGAFWRARLTSAIARRAGLAADPGTTGYRLVHGENDEMSGLVADLYGTTVVIKVYSEAWFPHLRDVLDAFLEACSATALTVDRIVVRTSRNVQHSMGGEFGEATTVLGEAPTGPVLFLENGLTFEADVLTGQKTGHFLDQRENRARVRGLAEGRRVLDVFACTGGFSVHGAAGGASAVTSVDLSRRSLATASANMEHNLGEPGVAACRHTITVGDAFEVMADLGRSPRRFDLVIVDPPSFAQKERDRDGALEAYTRLAALGMALVERGGVYVQSSCSSRVNADEFRAAVREGATGHRVEVIAATAHGADHPIGFAQGAYLKTLFANIG